MNEATLEAKFEAKNEDMEDTLEIWRFGKNDYAVNFINNECSVRGTMADVLDEIFSIFTTDELTEVEV